MKGRKRDAIKKHIVGISTFRPFTLSLPRTTFVALYYIYQDKRIETKT